MLSRDLLQGLFLAFVGCVFGFKAIGHPIGSLERFGPGFFPLVMSVSLVILSLAMIVRSRFSQNSLMHFNFRNITIILFSFGIFVLVSDYANMAVGIVFLVFISTLAGSSYSFKMNTITSAILIAIALLFDRLLGLPLKVL